ncbi:uracil-DNA glycosylase [bacterium]|nr:uracil-DNA glycosylase [bacterium]
MNASVGAESLCFTEVERVAQGWRTRLAGVFASPDMSYLWEFLRSERSAHEQIFPPQEDVFRALNMVDFDDVRVVVLGQDPYHGDGQANGLAFAVHSGVKAPPSLVNIFKEISADLSAPTPKGTSMLGWARQGVLLLNTVLTVRAHQAFSHRGKGWETFTDHVLRELNSHPQPIVFMLWGAPAQQKAKLISNPAHLILTAPHPSPLSAHRGFLGCRHFSKANAFLEASGRAVNWLSID